MTLWNSIFGSGGCFKHSAQPCKLDTCRKRKGDCHSKQTGEFLYQRNITVWEYCDPCECGCHADDFPTSSPDLNPAENAQNHLRQVVRKMCSENNRFTWTGNRRDKMKVLREAYWQNLRGLLKMMGNFTEIKKSVCFFCDNFRFRRVCSTRPVFADFS
jgi:hypothetical protein